ncbi:MAG: dipicolinate synthase subunit DpsA [Bacillota bacterium]|jgi:dipicolinate synthase subunit A
MKKIAMVGGDRREAVAAGVLRDHSYFVTAYGLAGEEGTASASLESCLNGADALILPARGGDENGRVPGISPLCPVTLTEAALKALNPSAPVCCGIASKPLRDTVLRSGHPLLEVLENDAVAVPNAALTAEGALHFVMGRLAETIRGKTVAVFGFGRVGRACAELFTAVGCRVSVFCRRERDLIAGRREGFDLRFLGGASVLLPKTDIVINTVPAAVVGGELLRLVPEKSLLIEVASSPGGIDGEEARRLGLDYVALPGLPGKYAPVSAGEILGSYYAALFDGGGEEVAR